MTAAQSGLRTLRVIRQAGSAKRAWAASRRQLHQRVPTAFDVDAGLPGFLSPEAVKTIAVDWQQGLLDRLNDLVRGTEVEHASVLQTIKQTASDPTMTLAFNYASEALNNSFFLSTLSPKPSEPSPNRAFWTNLSREESPLRNLPALVSHFSAHVAGMHPSSSGYVWLVTDQSDNIGVVGTYAGGTVLVQARAQMGPLAGDERVLGEALTARRSQTVDAAASSSSTASASTPSPPTSSPSTTAPGGSSQQPPRRPSSDMSTTLSLLSDLRGGATGFGSSSGSGGGIGKQLHPILCLSVNPHCYVQDYGVWGRDEYVKRWWRAIDWNVVETNWDKYKAKTSMSK